MEQTTNTERRNAYQVALPVFEGPLDLLLHLIERAELDITRVALAQVTDQYLAYIRTLEQQSPDDVSAFLVIASRLLQIKSEALLPRPPQREEGEEDPAESLARQLRLYKRFKELSIWLEERTKEGLRTYLRIAPAPKVEGTVDLDGMGLADLVQAAEAAFAREREGPEDLGGSVEAPRVTIRDKIRRIVGLLRSRGRVDFSTILGRARTRVEIVVTFLAVLELVKRQRVLAAQAGLFEQIELEPIEGLTEDEDELEFDLEFVD